MELTTKQETIIRSPKRFKVLNFGRRSGKTTAFAYEALITSLTINGANTTYYAQTFGDARDIAWDIFLNVFGNAVIKKNETLLEITLLNKHGGYSYVNLKGWESVYQSGKGRGTENHLVLCDEIDFCPQFVEYFDEVLAPTLLTTRGRALFASTPNGYSHLFRLKQRAEEHPEDWIYLHATSYDNPANSPEEIERIKSEISDEKFRREYLAEFIKLEGSGVFKDFSKCFKGTLQPPVSGRVYACGIDLARVQDRTVIIIADTHTNNVVYYEVMEKTPWSVQRRRIIDRIREYNNAQTVIDATGVGDAFVDTLYETGLPIEAFKISGASKRGLIEKLQMFLENGYITIPPWELLEQELNAFEYGVTGSGNVTYSSPEGMHDDTVLALALLVHRLNVNPTPYKQETAYDYAIKRGMGISSKTGYFE